MFSSSAPRRAWIAASLSILPLTLASCLASTPPPTPTPVGDDFAVVRATAEAAYRSGVVLLDQGDLERALVTLNQARVNDPDERGDIKVALAEAVRRVQALPSTPTRTPIPTRTPEATNAPTPAIATPTPGGSGGGRPTPPAGFALWQDSQGRFSLAAPADWTIRAAPESEFGRGVVGFRDPSGRADLTVAIDQEADVVSPELYAARMDLAMQRAPGYALEAIVPSVTANQPSLRRNFTISGRDQSGREIAATGFQVALLRGRTPYIVAGSAPSTEFARFNRTFDQIVGTLSFR